MIEFLIHLLTLGIEIKIILSWHGSLGTFDLIKLELIEHVLDVFGLVDESPFPQLLYFKPKEKLQLPHHGHLEAIGHELGKILIKSFVNRPKDNIIHIDLAYEQVASNFLSKKSGINEAHFEATV